MRAQGALSPVKSILVAGGRWETTTEGETKETSSKNTGRQNQKQKTLNFVKIKIKKTINVVKIKIKKRFFLSKSK